jgi:NAD(P)-dependent dehydrogenase (short-subunit alcohol dehydrogenase family)
MRVALVTGASRGIGAAIAQRLAADGIRVAVHYRRDEAAARRILAALPGEGHTTIQADVADPEAAETVTADVVRRCGGLDIVVNNAGIFTQHPIAETDSGAWQRAWRDTLAVNLLGPANLMHAALPHLLARGGGVIVNISSRGAYRGEPTAPAYGASKAGLNAASQSLAQALAPQKVYVYAVAPGFVATDMAADHLQGEAGEAIRRQSPLGRVAEPEEVAHVVAFLVAPGAEYLTGTVIDVNGASYLR